MTATDDSVPLEYMTIGDRLADLAQEFVGSCGCVAHRHTMVDALGLDPDSYFDWRPFAHLPGGKIQGCSTCFMFVGACLEQASICSEWHPWRISTPLGSLSHWAFVHGVWTKWQASLTPQRGDVLLLGKDGGTHVCIVSSLEDDALVTIDGGQCCFLEEDGHDGIGRQAVKRVTRTWTRHGTVIGANGPTPIVGWMSTSELEQ